MAKWKLCRQTFGNEEFEFSEGDKVTIGRGLNNTITLSSIVISRNHCLLNVKADEVSITDLKSSNGIYVGLKRIPPNVPYVLTDADVIGFGWTIGAPLAKVNDDEKYIFKLEKCISSITSRIQFQDNALDDIEAEIASFDSVKTSPILKSKLHLKRKLNLKFEVDEISKQILNTDSPKVNINADEIISIISDSDNETNGKQECSAKKIKLESVADDQIKQDIKCENDNFEYEAFNVKQEYLGYDDEPIEINSDSDSESEHWYRRLSQSSPGKPLVINDTKGKKADIQPEDGSYSQLDDVSPDITENYDDDEDDIADDLISIPPEPPENYCNNEYTNTISKEMPPVISPENLGSELEDVMTSDKNFIKEMDKMAAPVSVMKMDHNNSDSKKEMESDLAQAVLGQADEIGSNIDHSKEIENVIEPITPNNKTIKKTLMIEPLTKTTKRKSHASPLLNISESKSKSSHKSSKSKNHSASHKSKITNSQKEERKKKLKEIACKDKDSDDVCKDLAKNTNKSLVNVKVTTSNRGAFLSDVNQACVKPTKRKTSPLKRKDKNTGSPKCEPKLISANAKSSIKCDKLISEELKKTKEKCEPKESKDKPNFNSHKSRINNDSNTKPQFKTFKPLTDSNEPYLGKPVSKVEPLPPKKPKKTVRFSSAPPEIHEFEIEDGNKMRKTSSVKTTLVDVQKMKLFSLDKITLITILRWNPHWLNEQMTISEPPPILSHKNPPMTVFHSFQSHKDYVGVIGDLLLMEIWECITQAFNRTRNLSNELQLRIESCPLAPPAQDRFFQLSNIAVNLSLPTSEMKKLPRIGEIMTVEFGPEQARCNRFVYVHNVRHLPSPPNNINSFFSISLYATFTEKMKLLRPGELIIGRTLAYIKNELMLFEAIEYLAGSPLSNAILRPDPYDYPKMEFNDRINMNSQWTSELNPSQKLAVSNSVSAAIGDQPSIQMVQGPPGTGKSSVICAIVMTYFYDDSGKKQQNRNKILICATSNAAVDGLVIKLLKIRQSLPKSERFRMVRVGRLEAMHERARNVSSQHLAQRDVQADCAHPGLSEEISHLEAKRNMWKSAAREAKDPERVAYCQSRVGNMSNRLALLRNGAGSAAGAVAGERLAHAERRTIEGADIIVTTLASSHNYKMNGLKGRIALCIVDEAGQAIEPETLIPLTLDVTRLTLIGDPQQLPGYICSQRAKKHGLGESLFSRLTSCSEQWEASPVVLLDHQYRMHAAIAEYPNRAFYAGLVRSVPPPGAGLAVPPYLVLGVSSGDRGQGSSGANEMEAWCVARLAAALGARARERRLSLAVITPYSAHRDLLRDNLRELQPPSEALVEVNTVDSFQGQERDVVLVSLARSRGVGFLSDAGRMNVMLTRARHVLFVCLNPMAFVKNSQWQTLVDDARRRNLYTTLPSKFCQPISTASNSCDNILSYILSTKSGYRK